MSLALKQLLGTQKANARTVPEIDAALAFSDDAMGSEMDIISNLEKDINAAQEQDLDLAEHIESSNAMITDLLQLVSANEEEYKTSPLALGLTSALLSSACSEDDTEESTLQSIEGESPTLQIFKRAKDTVKRAISAFISLYNRITRLIYEWFKKHMGVVASGRRKNESYRKRLEKMADYTIEDQKIDIKGYANAIQVKKVTATNAAGLLAQIATVIKTTAAYSEYLDGASKMFSQLPAAVEAVDAAAIEKFLTANKDSVINYEMFRTSDEVKAYNKYATSDVTNLGKCQGKLVATLKLTKEHKGDVRWDDKYAVKTTADDSLLPGNFAVFNVLPVGGVGTQTLSEAASCLRKSGVQIREYTNKIGDAKNDSKFDTMSTADIESCLSSVDSLLDEMGIIMNGDAVYQVRQDLDKATSNYAKKTKELQKLDFSAEVRGIVNVLGGDITRGRLMYTDNAKRLAGICRTTINVTHRLVGASLANHKKEA